MAVVLTNGGYYIAHSKSGAVIKVHTVNEAQNFYTAERAMEQKRKTPGKTSGYYWVDTEAQKNKSIKRKFFTAVERMEIYRKTEGHCYLCGEFVDFDEFEVEHRVPISKGGTNTMDNLFCSCHTCNSIKQSILPADFLEKIVQIYFYQMKVKYGRRLKWRLVNWVLTRKM